MFSFQPIYVHDLLASSIGIDTIAIRTARCSTETFRVALGPAAGDRSCMSVGLVSRAIHALGTVSEGRVLLIVGT